MVVENEIQGFIYRHLVWYCMSVIDNLNDNQVNMILKISTILYLLPTIGDTVTTFIGLSNGFVEMNFLVDFLWIHLGLLGLIAVKIIATGYLIMISLPTFYFGKNLGKVFLSWAFILGFIAYGSATMNNIVVLL